MSSEKTSKAGRPSVERGERHSRASNVGTLAGREIKRTWPSYLTSGMFNFLFGIVALISTFAIWEDMSPSRQSDIDGFTFLVADLLFVLVLANLTANWTSPRYMDTRNDKFAEYLEFLRTLPILPSEAVTARAAVMLVSAAAMACVFFAPPYVFAGENIWSTLGPGHYLSFASVWVAYGLFSSGVLLFLEFGVRGAAFRFWCLMIWSAVLLGAVLLCNLVLDARLVAGTLTLTGEHGALVALVALATGISGFALFAIATAHRAGRRL